MLTELIDTAAVDSEDFVLYCRTAASTETSGVPTPGVAVYRLVPWP